MDAYNVLVLSVAASVAWETRQRRAAARVNVPARLTLITEDGRRLAATACNLSRGGAAVLSGPGRASGRRPVVAAFEHEGSRCDIAARVASASGGRTPGVWRSGTTARGVPDASHLLAARGLALLAHAAAGRSSTEKSAAHCRARRAGSCVGPACLLHTAARHAPAGKRAPAVAALVLPFC